MLPSVPFLKPIGADMPDASSRCTWLSVVRAPMAPQLIKSPMYWGDMTSSNSPPAGTPDLFILVSSCRAMCKPSSMRKLSPGPAPLGEIDSLRANAQMWRIEDDLWDNWKSLRAMYDRAESWVPLVAEGHWPDADMLPLGHIGLRAERGDDRLSLLSHDEQITLMTLWCIFRSPLMMGGDLPTLDSFTRSLLSNPEVLAVNQHSSGATIAYVELALG